MGTTAEKLQKLIDGKQYVIDKTNAKASSDLKINSTWQSIGDVIEGISGGSNGILKSILPVESNNYIEKIGFLPTNQNDTSDASYIGARQMGARLNLLCSLHCDEIEADSFDYEILLSNDENSSYMAIFFERNIDEDYWNVEILFWNEMLDEEIILYVWDSDEASAKEYYGFIGFNPNYQSPLDFNSYNIAFDDASSEFYDDANRIFNFFLTVNPNAESKIHLMWNETTLSNEYVGEPINITENQTIDIKAMIENEKKLPTKVNVNVETTIPNQVFAVDEEGNQYEVYGVDENGNKYLVTYTEVE